MPHYLLDTSALVKRYHREANTDKVLALFEDPRNEIHISHLTLIEARSAFAVKVRTGEISEAIATSLWRQLLTDVASGSFGLLPLVEDHYHLAEELIGRYAFRHRLRTLDALQLAVALKHNEITVIDGFILADQLLSEVASTEKLPVVLLE